MKFPPECICVIRRVKCSNVQTSFTTVIWRKESFLLDVEISSVNFIPLLTNRHTFCYVTKLQLLHIVFSIIWHVGYIFKTRSVWETLLDIFLSTGFSRYNQKEKEKEKFRDIHMFIFSGVWRICFFFFFLTYQKKLYKACLMLLDIVYRYKQRPDVCNGCSNWDLPLNAVNLNWIQLKSAASVKADIFVASLFIFSRLDMRHQSNMCL